MTTTDVDSEVLYVDKQAEIDSIKRRMTTVIKHDIKPIGRRIRSTKVKKMDEFELEFVLQRLRGFKATDVNGASFQLNWDATERNFVIASTETDPPVTP